MGRGWVATGTDVQGTEELEDLEPCQKGAVVTVGRGAGRGLAPGGISISPLTTLTSYTPYSSL